MSMSDGGRLFLAAIILVASISDPLPLSFNPLTTSDVNDVVVAIVAVAAVDVVVIAAAVVNVVALSLSFRLFSSMKSGRFVVVASLPPPTPSFFSSSLPPDLRPSPMPS